MRCQLIGISQASSRRSTSGFLLINQSKPARDVIQTAPIRICDQLTSPKKMNPINRLLDIQLNALTPLYFVH